MKVAIIGGGSLGLRIAKHLISKKILPPEDLLVVEKDEIRCDEIRRELSCYGSTFFSKALTEIKSIFLCVKPQDFLATAQELSPFITVEQGIISCLAGTKISVLREHLPTAGRFIRVMPNLALTVGEGVCVYKEEEGPGLSVEGPFRSLFKKTGVLIRVEDEKLVDAATALSGSGPGFFIYLLNSWNQVALELGFSPEDAQQLVFGTITGTLKLVQESTLSLDEWIPKIASKGGTTEAGLKVLRESDLTDRWQQAFREAFKRSQELS